MQLSYSNLACPDWPFERTVEAVHTYGFDGLEIRLFDGEVVTPALPAASRRRAEAALAGAGVPLVSLDTSLRVAEPDQDAFLADLEVMAEIAAQWGAPLLRLFGGPLPADPYERADALRRAGDLLGRAVPVAAEYGVGLALETHDDFSSARVVAQVLDFAGGGAGAVYDAHHPHRRGESPTEVLKYLADYLFLVQVKDAVRLAGEDKWQLVPIGEGEVPVHELLQSLPGAGYDGWVSLEFEKKWHPELAPPEEALGPQAGLLRRWLAELG